MIQDRRGRLLAACWKFAPFGNFALFSEDHGKTWRRSAPVPGDAGDECQLVELVSGRLLMDIRQETGASRSFSTSDDGGKTWSRAPGRLAGLTGGMRHRAVHVESGGRRPRPHRLDGSQGPGPAEPGRADQRGRGPYLPRRAIDRLRPRGLLGPDDSQRPKPRRPLGRGAAHGYQFITFTRLTREILAP